MRSSWTPNGSLRAVGACLLILLAGRPARSADGEAEAVLRAAAQYLAAYEPAFSLIVAEEEYVQRLRVAPGGPVHATRILRSDVVFVRSPGAPLPWTLLRDAYEVDGAKVRDREARLEKILLQPSTDAVARAKALADESTRFNVGRGVRNFNVPTLVLAFFHPSVQPRFAFTRGKDTSIDGRTFAEIAFREVASPTLIRRPSPGGDVRATGRAWIDPHDGTVARTELTLETAEAGAFTSTSLETDYRALPALALWVPVEMRERWEVRLTGARGKSGGVEFVDGVATYRGFRKAVVETEDEAHLPDSRP
jgi:hypothetical protein